MSRLLFLIVIFAVIYWLLKSYRMRVRKDRASADMPERAEDMVRCIHCGVHLPKHESILAKGEYFCSEAHLRTHTGRPEQP